VTTRLGARCTCQQANVDRSIGMRDEFFMRPFQGLSLSTARAAVDGEIDIVTITARQGSRLRQDEAKISERDAPKPYWTLVQQAGPWWMTRAPFVKTFQASMIFADAYRLDMDPRAIWAAKVENHHQMGELPPPGVHNNKVHRHADDT